jgi:acyl carrier protein
MHEAIINQIEELSFTRVSVDDLLWTEKILDSITIVELVVFIESEFGIKVPNADIIESNFNSVNAIVDYINRSKTPIS